METDTTALLLNWKRPENIERTIQSIRDQNLNVKIWLWNNNPNNNKNYDVDLQINSPKNFKCWPRWLIGSLVDTKYIFTLDDDLTFADNDTLNTMRKKHMEYEGEMINDKKNGPTAKRAAKNIIVGFLGLNIGHKSHPYTTGKDFKPANVKNDTFVDIVKGRCMFMNSSLLNKVTMEYEDTVEDIKISSYSDINIITPDLKGKFGNLKEGGESLHKQSDHMPKRNKAAKKYFF